MLLVFGNSQLFLREVVTVSFRPEDSCPTHLPKYTLGEFHTAVAEDIWLIGWLFTIWYFAGFGTTFLSLGSIRCCTNSRAI